MTEPIETTMTPLVVGILALGMLRHWRRRDHADLVAWMALAKRLIEGDSASPSLTVHSFEPRDGYDAWADTYDGGNPLIAREQEVLESVLATSNAGRALDAACGTGRVAEILNRHGHQVVGVDQSTAMLDRARDRLPTAEFKIGTLENLPVDADSFDLVVSALAMTHAVDLGRAMTALARAARPGGRVVVTEVHPFNATLGAHPNFSLGGGTVGSIQNTEYTISDYIHAFEQAGLSIVDLHEPSFRHSEATAMSSALAADLGAAAAEAFGAALIGFPMALIWDLRKK